MKKASYACDFAKAKIGQAYWMGTFGQKCSYDLLAEKKRSYPQYYDQSKYSVKFTDQIQAGLKCADCSGLIKWILWSESIENDSPKYNLIPGTDLSANDMINKGCTKTGDISTMPDVPGLIVWKSGHVGIYVGKMNGVQKVVEARGHDWGIVMTDLASRGWQKYGYLKWFDYSEPTPTPTTKYCQPKVLELQKGDKNSTVKVLQTLLNLAGVKDQKKKSLEVDGSFGSRTFYVVKKYQASKGLNADGIVGEKTWTSLLT